LLVSYCHSDDAELWKQEESEWSETEGHYGHYWFPYDARKHLKRPLVCRPDSLAHLGVPRWAAPGQACVVAGLRRGTPSQVAVPFGSDIVLT
jgi:hypothetical protein